MKPLISIIIPVYNSFSLLEKCLSSLNAQTVKNFEVIFVDDCSKDGSFRKLQKKLSKMDFSWNLIQNKKNSGPGISRNNGIRESQGKYLAFIDSDDYVENNLIELLEVILSESQPDIIIYDYYMTSKNKKVLKKSMLIQQTVISPEDAVALSNGMCWGKLYRKDVIIKNKIEFPDLIRSEDLAFIKVFLSKCNNIYYLQKPLYYYMQNDHSIMHTVETMDINNNKIAFEYIQKHTNFEKAVEMVFIREYLYLITQIMILKGASSREIKKFIADATIIYPNWNRNIYIKYQPKYLQFILKLIKWNAIFPIRLIFQQKK